MRLILAGFGVVGQSFAKLIVASEPQLATAYGLVPQVVAVMDSSGAVVDEHGLNLKRLIALKREKKGIAGPVRGKRSLDVIREVEAEVLVEATPTNFRDGEPGLSHIRAAFETKKHVVTCNKGPLAVAFQAIHELARHNGVQLRFSGAVGGGTPILDFGRTCSLGDRLVGMKGVLNGTCNYILTSMEEKGTSFGDALESAQKAGYAETDPALDIDGIDAAVKLVIAANHLALSRSGLDDVKIKGIRDISAGAVEDAKRKGKAVRLIASAGGRLSVEPVLLERSDPLCVNGTNNAVQFDCLYSGPKVIIGKGAGGPETASSLLRDLIEIRAGMNGAGY